MIDVIGVACGVQLIGSLPWGVGLPQMVPWENSQPSSGMARRFRFSAFANAYVPGAGMVVPPAEGKMTTIAAVERSVGGGRPGTGSGMTKTGDGVGYAA